MVEVVLWLLLLLAAASAAFWLAEMVARLWFRWRRATYVWKPNSRTLLNMDLSIMKGFSPQALIAFNRDGERGDEPPRNWRDTHRILVIGGSAAECYSLDQRQAWPALIQERLRRPDALTALGVGSVHVGSVARSTFPAEVAVRILPEIGHRYRHLDTIIVMLGASDVLRWMANGTPSDLSKHRMGLSGIFAQHANGPFRWRLRHLALYRLAQLIHQRLFRPVDVKHQVGRRVQALRDMRAEASTMLDEAPDPAPMLAEFERNFRLFLSQAKAAAPRVLVVRQPWLKTILSREEERNVVWNFAQGNPHAQKVEVYYSMRLARELMGKVDALQARIADEAGVEQIDLRGEIDCDLTTFYDFFHFTPAGAQAVAKVVADRLLAPAGSRKKVSDLAEEAAGDDAAMSTVEHS